jgi:serine/threonine-protein kinase
LEAAHSNGVLHRDVKPANLMFTANGTVKLSDFGIAKLASGDGVKTRAGYVLGTALYIAPEQVLGNPITPATDIYGLATTLYQLLSGTLPFPTDVDSTTTYIMHAHGRPTPLTRVAPSVPSPLADVVMRGLATDPSNRWRTAEEFGVALAASATRCWGRNWLAQAGVPVLGNDSIKAATAAISSPAVGATPWPAAPPESRPSRPKDAVAEGDSPSPRMPYIVAGVLGVAVIALALIGLGSPPRGGDLKAGTVTIAGVDPVTVDEVEIDMTKPVEVTVAGVPGDTAALAQNVLGLTLSDHDASLTADGRSLTAEVDPPNPYVVAGRTTGELRISNGGDTTASFRFGMRSTQPAAMTAFAGGVLFVALFAVAYIESYSRTLRRGRNQVSAKVGLPVATAALALAMVGVVWILVGREPTVATLFGCAAIGAGAGVSGTIAAIRHDLMNRNRRRQRTPRPPKVSGRPQPPTKAIGKTPRPREDDDTERISADRRRNKGTKIQRG